MIAQPISRQSRYTPRSNRFQFGHVVSSEIMHRLGSPTLLVFTLGPGREQARRRWLGRRGAAAERRVHEQCLESVLEAGRAADCVLRLASPTAPPSGVDVEVAGQRGATFGRRLLNAVADAERRASGPLVVVGTDTPGVGPELVAEVLEAVDSDPDTVVIGPAADGGIYLLAAARSIIEELGRVKWRSSQTLESLRAALRESGRAMRLLPVLRDLDTRRDLERWTALGALRSGWRRVVALVREALARLVEAPPPIARALGPLSVTVAAGRAPPR